MLKKKIAYIIILLGLCSCNAMFGNNRTTMVQNDTDRTIEIYAKKDVEDYGLKNAGPISTVRKESVSVVTNQQHTHFKEMVIKDGDKICIIHSDIQWVWLVIDTIGYIQHPIDWIMGGYTSMPKSYSYAGSCNKEVIETVTGPIYTGKK